MARPTIFEGKGGLEIKSVRVQGDLTRRGGRLLDAHRDALARLYADVIGTPFPRSPSDADVIEYLARGEEETREYLRRKRKTKPAAR